MQLFNWEDVGTLSFWITVMDVLNILLFIALGQLEFLYSC